jgi:hypothetical protein
MEVSTAQRSINPHAKPASDDCCELDAVEFASFCEEVRLQPNWRREADSCADYYDGNQLDAETAADLSKKGMGPLIVNLIKPTIDVVLGMEAKTRSDWRVEADSDDWQEVAEGLSAKMNEAERESRADRACSDAYAQQVKSGIGWVEVTRDSDPFKPPYRVRAVHRREIFWDWSSKEPDISDARYLIRQKWYGIDEACAYLPEHKELIRQAGLGWPAEWIQRGSEDISLVQSYDTERRMSLSDWEWRNIDRRMVSFFECWYRRFKRGLVIRMQDGRAVEFDEKNPVHVVGVARGMFRPEPAIYSVIRVSLWLGPHKLHDFQSNLQNFPYIPFFGYREDLTGVPYGLVRAMISPQEEINARRRKLLWMLSSKVVQVDSDALDQRYNDFRDLVSEVARPDAVIITNPARKNPNGFTIGSNMEVSTQQYQVMQEAKQALQEAAGVFNQMMGKSDSGVTAGKAIDSLIEQGTTTLAELTDNYRYARRLVGEALLNLVSEDLTGRETQIHVGEPGRRKVIILNQDAVDPMTGLRYVRNDVRRAPIKVALSDVPTTPAYKQQMQVMLAEVMKSLPDQLQAIMAPYFLESTNLPKRMEMADAVRKAMGMQGPEGEQVDPQVLEMQGAMDQMQMAMEQGAAQYEEQIATLTQQVNEFRTIAKDKAAELELKRWDMSQREAEREQNALLEDRRLEGEMANAAREAQARLKEAEAKLEEARAKQIEARAKLQDAESAREADLLKSDKAHELESRRVSIEERMPPEKDEAAEAEKVAKMIEQAVAPLLKQVEDVSKKIDAIPAEKEEKREPVEQPMLPPMTFNIQVDAKSEPGKKTIVLKKDKDGNTLGATVEEAPEAKPKKGDK